MFKKIIYIIIALIGLGVIIQLQVFRTETVQALEKRKLLGSAVMGLKTAALQMQMIANTLTHGILSSTEKNTEQDEEIMPVYTETPTGRNVVNSDNILYYTNLERTKRGLRPLRFSAKLTRSANAKSRDMFTNQYFAHESPIDTKKGPAYFIDAQNYNFARASENLAMGDFATAKDVVDAWMNSPTHRSNILYTDYRDIGASVQTGTMGGKKVVMIVQHFGAPINTCPTVSVESLEKLKIMEADASKIKSSASELEQRISKDSTISDTELDGLINTYNTMIRKYNALVENFQKASSDYNNQIEKYNNCIQVLSQD